MGAAGRFVAGGLLLAAIGVGPAAGQTVLLGGGPVLNHRGAGELADFAASYDRVNASLIAKPFGEPGGATSLSWDVRASVTRLPLHVSLSLGVSGYTMDLRSELTSGGGRTVRLDVDDHVAALEVAYARAAGGGRIHAGPALVARIRETTLTSVRRAADGSTDAGQATPQSSLSGEFTGAVTQLAAGGVVGWTHPVGGRLAVTARAAVTWPVGERPIMVHAWLERLDDVRFPVDLERFQAEGNVATPGNALMAGMEAMQFEVGVGMAFVAAGRH